MHETSWNTVCQFCGTKHCWRTEIDRLRRELEEHQAAKWKEKHVDTMNDMAALRIALEGVEAQLSDARRELEEARKALEPFADAVFNDNGDMTVNRSFPTYDDFVRAYFAHKKARAAFKAPGKMRKPTDHEYELIAGIEGQQQEESKG